MKNTIYNLIKGLTFLIIVGIFIFTFFRWCNPPQPEEIIIKDTIVIVEYKDSIKYDTIIHNNWKTIKEIIYKNDTILQIDTVEFMINDYFAKVNYKDTILNDSNGLIIISDTLYMNRLLNRFSAIKLINTTKIIQDSKGHFYLGVGTQINDNISLSVNGYFQKKNYLVGLGYNTNKQFMLNYSYKIK